VAQAEDAHQCGLQLEEFRLAFVFFLCAVAEGFFQEDQVAAEFHLGQDQPAQGFEGVALFGRQFAGSLVDDAERAECVTVLADERRSSVEADVRVRND